MKVGDLVRIMWSERGPLKNRQRVSPTGDAIPHRSGFDGQMGIIVSKPFPNAHIYEVQFSCGETHPYEPWHLEVVCEPG